MFFRRHPVRDEQLNAYLDGQLAPAEGARVRAHADGCARCRQTLDELRAVRSALRALPQRPAPRSYALREVDVRPAPRVPMSGLTRAMPLLSGLTAAALVAFVVLVGLDVSARGSGGDTDHAPAITTSQEAAERAPADDTTQQNGAPERYGPQSLQGGGRIEADGGAPTEGADDGADDDGAEGGFVVEPLPQGTQTPREQRTPLGLAPAPPLVEPTPTVARRADAALEEDGDRVPWRAAQAATAAVALLGGASLAFVWWRRRA